MFEGESDLVANFGVTEGTVGGHREFCNVRGKNGCE